MGNRCETRREETMRKGGREETILVPLGQYVVLTILHGLTQLRILKTCFVGFRDEIDI